MGKKLLFICSRNRFRSPTAQEMFAGDGVETDSAGTEKDARVIVGLDQVLWADVIYAMEARHAKRLKEMFAPHLKGKRIIVLGIRDDFGFMDPALVELLRAKLKSA